MKNKRTYKSFILGTVVGLSIITAGTYATVTQSGTIGSLFHKVEAPKNIENGVDATGQYRLNGEMIEDKTLTAAEIKDDSITDAALAPNSVGNSELQNDSVTTDKILNDTIIGEDLKDNSITGIKLLDDSVTTNKIKDATILPADLAENSIGNREVNNGTDFVMNKLTLDSEELLLGKTQVIADTLGESVSIISDGNHEKSEIVLKTQNQAYGRIIGLKNSGVDNFGLMDILNNWIIQATSLTTSFFAEGIKAMEVTKDKVLIAVGLEVTGDVKVNGNTDITGNLTLGGKLDGSSIADGTVNTLQLADNSVTSAKIQDDTITESDISDSFVARDSSKLGGLDSSAYQKDISNSACEFGIASIADDGTVVCSTVTGPKGDKGDKGDRATVAVGTTTTGAAGTQAKVTDTGTPPSDSIFNFTIPKGDKGNTGLQGPAGPTIWQLNGNKVYYNNGNVGIGTNDPQGKLHVTNSSGGSEVVLETLGLTNNFMGFRFRNNTVANAGNVAGDKWVIGGGPTEGFSIQSMVNNPISRFTLEHDGRVHLARETQSGDDRKTVVTKGYVDDNAGGSSLWETSGNGIQTVGTTPRKVFLGPDPVDPKDRSAALVLHYKDGTEAGSIVGRFNTLVHADGSAKGPAMGFKLPGESHYFLKATQNDNVVLKTNGSIPALRVDSYRNAILMQKPNGPSITTHSFMTEALNVFGNTKVSGSVYVGSGDGNLGKELATKEYVDGKVGGTPASGDLNVTNNGVTFKIMPGRKGGSIDSNYTTLEMGGSKILYVWDDLEVAGKITGKINHYNNLPKGSSAGYIRLDAGGTSVVAYDAPGTNNSTPTCESGWTKRIMGWDGTTARTYTCIKD